MFEAKEDEPVDQQRRRKALLLVGALGLLVVLLVSVLIRLAFKPGHTSTGLEDAVRAGSPEFEAYVPKLAFEEKEIIVHPNLIGMAQYEVRMKLTNRGDRTLTGVELLGRIITHDDKVVAQNISLPIPRIRKSLAPGETMRISVKVDGPGNVSEAQVKDVTAELKALKVE